MKKRIGIILAGLLAGSLFAGSAFAQEGEWTREFEGESLTFLDVAPNDVRTGYYEALFEQFYEDTGIEVEYQSVPWDDAADKITVLGASGNLPDILTTWSGWLGQRQAGHRGALQRRSPLHHRLTVHQSHGA